MKFRHHSRKRILFCVLRSVACVAAIGVMTACLYTPLRANALIAGFAYVLAVLIVAAYWGLAESLVTSLAAVLCLNVFFIPPVLSITIADPQNWVALFVFMVTAVTASKLSAQASKQTAEARLRRVEVERLYQLSISLMLMDAGRELGQQIAAHVRERMDVRAVAFRDAVNGAVHLSGAGANGLDGSALKETAALGRSWSVLRRDADAENEIAFAPVALGGRIYGSLGILGPLLSDQAVQAVTNLAAVALEHAHQQIEFGRLEVARQSERLRSMLLDALAHDFLTPLTAIKSAISTVRSEYRHETEESEFLAVVEEESDKLGEMINEITDMARIEPGRPRIKLRQIPVSELITSSVGRMRHILSAHPLDVLIEENLPLINADPEMLGIALRQVLSNAAKFSSPETWIEIHGYARDGAVAISVRDYGPGIPSEEREAVFDRFYRGKGNKETVAGTGMGLSIARDIVQAHRGRIWVEEGVGGGACFLLSLPVSQEEQGR